MVNLQYGACFAISNWLIHSVNIYWAQDAMDIEVCENTVSVPRELQSRGDINQSHMNNKNQLLLLLIREFSGFPHLLLLSLAVIFPLQPKKG